MRKGIKHEKASPFFDKLVFSKVEFYVQEHCYISLDRIKILSAT
jgi:hypothetical protein